MFALDSTKPFGLFAVTHLIEGRLVVHLSVFESVAHDRHACEYVSCPYQCTLSSKMDSKVKHKREVYRETSSACLLILKAVCSMRASAVTSSKLRPPLPPHPTFVQSSSLRHKHRSQCDISDRCDNNNVVGIVLITMTGCAPIIVRTSHSRHRCSWQEHI